MHFLKTYFFGATLLSIAVLGSACQETPVTNTNVAVNTANTNAAANVANTDLSSTTDAGPTIEAREPEQYRATLVFNAEATGQQRSAALPSMAVQVERNGDAHRLTFKSPTGQEFIYLDSGGRKYAILPHNKQYAELNREATGFDLPRLMMPNQVVARLQRQPGFERVGEEDYKGRQAVKYRYAGRAQTGTQAGQVQAETFTYVDKATGLPLRFDLLAQAGGSVAAMTGLRLVGEMRDLTTNVDSSRFELPQGYNQIAPEEVRRQAERLIAQATPIVNMILGAMMGAPGTSPAPAAPSPTVR